MSSRASLLVLGLLLALFTVSCGEDVNLGTSELDPAASSEDGGSSEADAGDGSTAPANGDELARIAEEIAGTWRGSFVDLDFTLELTYTGDRGGTARFTCTREGEDCREADAGVNGNDIFSPGTKYTVIQLTSTKTMGVLTISPGVAVGFTLDLVKNTMTVGPPLLLFAITFSKDEPADSSRAR